MEVALFVSLFLTLFVSLFLIVPGFGAAATRRRTPRRYSVLSVITGSETLVTKQERSAR